MYKCLFLLLIGLFFVCIVLSKLSLFYLVSVYLFIDMDMAIEYSSIVILLSLLLLPMVYSYRSQYYSCSCPCSLNYSSIMCCHLLSASSLFKSLSTCIFARFTQLLLMIRSLSSFNVSISKSRQCSKSLNYLHYCYLLESVSWYWVACLRSRWIVRM